MSPHKYPADFTKSAGGVIVYAIIAVFLLLQGCVTQRETFTFLFFADTQAGDNGFSAFEQLAVLAAGLTDVPELAVFGGDMVDDGRDTGQWTQFCRAAQPLGNMITAAVPGNHDGRAPLADYFDYPAETPENALDGLFYSFDMGGIHFIMLDSNIMGAANESDIKWLESDLRSADSQKAQWRVAVMHHPMWSVTENQKDMDRAETMREYFLPLLEEYGVDLILCGHQHNYARTAAGYNTEQTPVQIMTASGGKEAYAAGQWDYIEITGTVPAFLLLTNSGETLTVTAYNSDGEPFDRLEVT